MIEHRNVVHYLQNPNTAYCGRENDKRGTYLQLPYTFDASVTSLFMPLIQGGKLVIAQGGSLTLFEEESFWQHTPYDFLKLTPGMLPLLKQQMELRANRPVARRLVIGGEALTRQHIEPFRDQGLHMQLINEYGPTETTVGCTTYCMETDGANWPQAEIPIGRPIANMCVYLLDNNKRLVPAGVTGEIYLGGAGLARGYWKLPALTAERFIPNPFDATGSSRLYRTGDLGRWLPDGNMEYLGRIDDQVKIRGYRIELGEIENTIQQCGLTAQHVVTTRTDAGGNKLLVAYVVPLNGEYNKAELIDFLRTRLPEYMVPTVWVELESMPLTANGKVDKKALLKLQPDTDTDAYVAPRNPLEAALAAIWCELLGIERVGINDNFLALGGHSLLAARMISLIRKKLGIELSVKELFLYPAIAQLAAYIKSREKTPERPPITKQVRPKHIPLSFHQERLWFIHRLEGSAHYHIPWVLRLQGDLNVAALEFALRELVNRHEVLRTVIREQEGIGYQHVLDKNSWTLQRMDGSSYAGRPGQLTAAIASCIETPFDLTAEPMLRACLFKLHEQEYKLVLILHHIAADGLSWPILEREVSLLYEAAAERTQVALQELPVQYADYALWQKQWLQGEELEKRLAYWRKQLNGVAMLELPVDHRRPAEQSNRGGGAFRLFDEELTKKLRLLARASGATLYMTLLAACKVLLHRYSGQDDICVGTPVAGRVQQETEGMIGFFVNTLALRTDLSGNPAFNELLRRVQQTALEAYEHQDVPFEKIVEAVVQQRDPGRSPLFQVLFAMQPAQEKQGLQLKGITIEKERHGDGYAKFDLAVTVTETENELACYINYSTDLYRPSTIERMLDHYEELLRSIVSHAGAPIDELRIITGEEEQRLSQFNNTEAVYVPDKTLVHLLHEQATKTPAATAVIFAGQQLAYSELQVRSNRLAHYLRKRGVREDNLVAICLERSMEMVIGILGILKAGGAYVPIDPELPQERIAYMLHDTGVNIVLSTRKALSSLPTDYNRDILLLDEQWNEIQQEPDDLPVTCLQPGHLAYLIYTSGSTGQPKGVTIEHQACVNMVMFQQQYFGLTAGMRILQFANLAFDGACWEILGALSNGCQLVIPMKEEILSPGKLTQLLKTLPIDIVTLPPSYQYAMQDVLPELKTVISAGEPLNKELAKYMRSKGVRLINGYGPTENTVCATLSDDPVDEYDQVVIGRPALNVHVYILDKKNRLAPIGIPGEICLSGKQLARGYWNRPELTAERFVPNPFDTLRSSRLYRTGDLGRWLPNGNIEYLGRIDEQVKIRGFRIEPGEIESLVQQSGWVRQCVVTAGADDKGNKWLTAYVIPEAQKADTAAADDDGRFNGKALLAYLQQLLPEYMIPKKWVVLDSLPLTQSGKVDKKALPQSGAIELPETTYVAPRNELEQVLAGCWCELLNLPAIGISDDFFHAGGHSLKAIQLIAAIKKKLNIEISISMVFRFPTIAAMAEYIELIKTNENAGLNLAGQEVFEL